MTKIKWAQRYLFTTHEQIAKYTPKLERGKIEKGIAYKVDIMEELAAENLKLSIFVKVRDKSHGVIFQSQRDSGYQDAHPQIILKRLQIVGN
ncbi:hypothetical protein QE152_g4688 [Popillia japonica]|uniref:Uncharacterized protein n=1 Tax=Popillia japonica TaxID=7064 RepID=A0AAW1N1Q4_POPJA